jgi:hypothetical protein
MTQKRSPFRPEIPVLWLDPQPPKHALAERHLLWPAWSYLVLAPHLQPRRRGPLNIIDEAFLRLLEAGQRNVHELERTLQLDRSLVAYVHADLLHRGLRDIHGAPTEQGLRALRDRAERDEELSYGHVFREPATGALWGRFVERPGYAEVEWRRRSPRLVLGPEGSARRLDVLPVAPEQAETRPPAPRVEEVLREIEINRRALAGGDARARASAPEPAQLARISLVRAQPEPVWLAVPVYATRVEDDGEPWHACDPFGIGSSPQLRRAIERRATSSPELAALLIELTREGAARRGTAAFEPARAMLGERFGERLQDVPGLQGALIDMQLALDKGVKQPRAVAAARAQVRGVLERLLRLTLGDAGSEVAIDLVGDREHDSALIADHAEALGFESLPRGMRGVTAAAVRATAEHRSGSLRPLFAANVLAAALDAEQPLRVLAARRPAFPIWLDALAETREPDTEEWSASTRRSELERLGSEALDIVELVLTTKHAARALEV